VVATVRGPRRVVGVDTRGRAGILGGGAEALLFGREVAEVEHRPCGGLGGGVTAVSHDCGRTTMCRLEAGQRGKGWEQCRS
jgi:hypothetical protein